MTSVGEGQLPPSATAMDQSVQPRAGNTDPTSMAARHEIWSRSREELPCFTAIFRVGRAGPDKLVMSFARCQLKECLALVVDKADVGL